MPDKEESGGCGIILLFVLFFVILLIIGGGCWYGSGYYYEPFTNNNNNKNNKILGGKLYNPLYTSPDMNSLGSYYYTQPPGSRSAEKFAGVNQGTNGEFFPIQGRAAGVFMKNSSNENLSSPSQHPGKIGSYPNYNKQEFSSRWTGFNNFGSPFSLQKGPAVNDKNYSNSYLISGGNQRVTNSGQKSNLPCQNWWPYVKKGEHGFCTQGSDAMVTCKGTNRNVNSCKGQGGNRFLRDKMGARWKKVINP